MDVLTVAVREALQEGGGAGEAAGRGQVQRRGDGVLRGQGEAGYVSSFPNRILRRLGLSPAVPFFPDQEELGFERSSLRGMRVGILEIG